MCTSIQLPSMNTNKDTDKIRGRLKAIKGQLGLVISMVQNKKDYFSIIQQSKAVNGGLKKLNCRILQHHLKQHTFKEMNELEQQEDFRKLMEVIKKYKSCKS